MGYIQKRGDVYRAFVQRGGHRPSRSFATRREALDWMIAEEAACLAGERGPGAGAHTLADAIDRYLGSAEHSRTDRVRLARFRREPFAADLVGTLTQETFSTWRDERRKQVSDGTVIREMTAWRALLSYACADLGWLAANPIKGVRRPPVPKPRQRIVSAEETSAMLEALDWREVIEKPQHEVACAFLLALETGMRCGELLALKPGDVAPRVAHVRESKNGDARDVPLSKRACQLLGLLLGKRLHGVRKRSDGRLFHVNSASLDTTFRRARSAAGLSGFTFHDSRATAVTRLAKILDIHDLARMIGHRDLNSLLVYYRESADSIAERLD